MDQIDRALKKAQKKDKDRQKKGMGMRVHYRPFIREAIEDVLIERKVKK